MGEGRAVAEVAVTVDELTVVIGLLNVLAEDNGGDPSILDLARRTTDRLQALIAGTPTRQLTG